MIGIIIITALLLGLYGLAYLICHKDGKYYISPGVKHYYKNFRKYYEQTVIVSEKKEEQKSEETD